MNMFGTID